MSELTSFGFRKGNVLGDTSTTGSGTVEYKDCSALLPTTGKAVLGVTILGAGSDACAFVSWVESTSPATTPTVSATSGDACMALVPVNVEKFFTVDRANPVLAYATTTAAGQMRVRKASG